MNNAQNDPKRIVLPRWLPFEKASQERELTAFRTNSPVLDRESSVRAFREHLAEFAAAPQPFLGSELMGVAVVLGEKEAACRLAEYVLTQPILRSQAADTARRILGRGATHAVVEANIGLQSTKARVRSFVRDGLSWMDQARLYTIKGQYAPAEKSVRAALHLCANDRFVIRSAIRFYVHFHRWDLAFDCAQRGYQRTGDPLIFGPLLGIAMHIGKTLSRTKVNVEAALRGQDILLHSETLEAFGTLEVLNGATQRSKRFFKQAWIDPTVSVVGHSQWILREHLPTWVADEAPDFSRSKEALGWLRFAMLDFDAVNPIVQDWALEEPFSRSPYVLGSNAACLTDSFSDAENLARQGLLANPRDLVLLNNLAFAQLRQGNLNAAEVTFAPVRACLSDPKEVAPMATNGLLRMMRGEVEEGVDSYLTAIRRAHDLGDRRLVLRATLNLVISTLDVAKKVDLPLLKSAQVALRGQSDAGCLGAALAITRRLERSDISGTDELSTGAREFCDAVKKEVASFRKTLVANLLELSKRRSSAAAHP
jgi:tetratricopeptide (TPR) repeat protein